MNIVFLSGSPSDRSRSALLLDYARQWLAKAGIQETLIKVSDLDAQALVSADFKHPDILQVIKQVQHADGLVIASPVYKGAYSGVLKTLLDLFPERALENKVVLPLMTAGSHAHLLALDYALKPLLGAMKAEEIINGIYAVDTQIRYAQDGNPAEIAPEIIDRLEQNLQAFLSAIQRRPAHNRIGRLSAVG